MLTCWRTFATLVSVFASHLSRTSYNSRKAARSSRICETRRELGAGIFDSCCMRSANASYTQR
jgi:hypothetical protein